VPTVASPRFYGFTLSGDGSELLLTEGRDQVFDAEAFDAWTVAEGVHFAVENNALVMNLGTALEVAA